MRSIFLLVVVALLSGCLAQEPAGRPLPPPRTADPVPVVVSFDDCTLLTYLDHHLPPHRVDPMLPQGYDEWVWADHAWGYLEVYACATMTLGRTVAHDVRWAVSSAALEDAANNDSPEFDQYAFEVIVEEDAPSAWVDLLRGGPWPVGVGEIQMESQTFNITTADGLAWRVRPILVDDPSWQEGLINDEWRMHSARAGDFRYYDEVLVKRTYGYGAPAFIFADGGSWEAWRSDELVRPGILQPSHVSFIQTFKEGSDHLPG